MGVYRFQSRHDQGGNREVEGFAREVSEWLNGLAGDGLVFVGRAIRLAFSAVVPSAVTGAVSAVGASSAAARSDHVHDFFPAGTLGDFARRGVTAWALANEFTYPFKNWTFTPRQLVGTVLRLNTDNWIAQTAAGWSSGGPNWNSLSVQATVATPFADMHTGREIDDVDMNIAVRSGNPVLFFYAGLSTTSSNVSLIGGTATRGTNTPDGYYFKYDSAAGANWRAITRSAGVETNTDTGVAADGAQHHFVIVNDATTSRFYIDEVLRATNTTNLYGSSVMLLVQMNWTAGIGDGSITARMASMRLGWS